MKVIETEYKGYRFRSRLEARWAVFFDACGVNWEYEPEVFDLGDELRYLPDFLLHDVWVCNSREKKDLWIEVKGVMTERDKEKIIKFHYAPNNATNPILILTGIPVGNTVNDFFDFIFESAYYSDYPSPFNLETIHNDNYAVLPCIDTQGRFDIIGGDYMEDIDNEATVKAYRLARQERFDPKSSREYSFEDTIDLGDGEIISQGQMAICKTVLLAPDGETDIDFCCVKGTDKLFTKVARISHALGYKNPSISLSSPLIVEAHNLSIPTPRFFTKRLSGGKSYNSKAYYIAIEHVPTVLGAYSIHAYKYCIKPLGRDDKIKRFQNANKLRNWFLNIVPSLINNNTGA